MRVRVRAYGPLARGRPAEAQWLELPEGASIASLLATLGLRPGDVGVVLRNGRAVADLGAALAEGDEVGLYPLVAGG